ncbi:MAG: DapH/DapD/GlmU-related protein [Bacillota bacterium]
MSDYICGENVRIGRNVVIGEGAVLGNNITIHDNVVIKKGATIGDNAIIGYREYMPDRISDEDLTEINENVRIRSGAVIYWGTRIGRNSSVGHNAVLRERTIIGHDTYIGALNAFEGDTKVGNYVGLNSQCHITKFSEIGDYVFIAPLFVCANDRAIAYRRSGHGHDLQGITIEKNVRIAIGVTALPGIRLGEGSIIGAGSVVTRDVPPYKVAYGNPARVVRDAPKEDIVSKP